MPFTLAHPAIVLPIHKRWRHHLPLSALVIGSVSPDLAYFIKLGISGNFTHSFAGIFLYCLPVSLVFYYLYHLLLKQPLITLLPSRLAGTLRVQQDKTLPDIPYSMLVLSVIIGALTHVLWDSFTHYNMWPVQHFALLKATIIQFDGYTLYTYRLIQHISTLLGIAYIFLVIRQYMRRSEKPSDLAVLLPFKWQLLLYLAIIFVGFYNSDIWRFQPTFGIWYGNLFHIATHAISGILAAIMVYALIWNSYHYFWIKKRQF